MPAVLNKEAVEELFQLEQVGLDARGRVVSLDQAQALAQVPRINDNLGLPAPDPADKRPNLWQWWMVPERYGDLEGVPMYERIKRVTVNEAVRRFSRFDHPKKLYLDLGAGGGAATEPLVKGLKGRVVAVDYMPQGLKGLQQRAARWPIGDRQRVAIERASAYDLPFEDDTFNGGVATWFYQYHSEAEQEMIAREVRRTVKEGEAFVFNTFVDGVFFKDVVFSPAMIPLLKEVAMAPQTLAIFRRIPILMRFGELQKEGRMNHPKVDDLLQLWREAGFKGTYVAQDYRENGAHPLRWNYQTGKRFAVTVVAR